MPEEIKKPEQENLEQLVRENFRMTKEIHRMAKRMNRHVTMQQILSVIYFVLIVIPIILSAIYIPRIFGGYLDSYRDLLNGSGGTTNTLENLKSPKAGDILDEAQRLLNNQ